MGILIIKLQLDQAKKSDLVDHLNQWISLSLEDDYIQGELIDEINNKQVRGWWKSLFYEDNEICPDLDDIIKRADEIMTNRPKILSESNDALQDYNDLTELLKLILERNG